MGRRFGLVGFGVDQYLMLFYGAGIYMLRGCCYDVTVRDAAYFAPRLTLSLLKPIFSELGLNRWEIT